MYNNPQFISYSQALKEGVQLWVLSESEYSVWNHRIDWYLCFQIRKSRLQEREKLSEKTKSLLKKYHFYSFEMFSSESSPVLIESSRHLPNLWTVELPYHSKWINKVYDIWCYLNQPTLRIFAPLLVKKQEIEEKWKGSNSVAIQCVFNETSA